MKNTSRCKEKMSGELGRWRTYRCRNCGDKFEVNLLRPYPKGAELCAPCVKANLDLKAQFERAFEERDRKEVG